MLSTVRAERNDKAISGALDAALAATTEDFDAAFRLVHDRYVARGYARSEASGRRVTVHQALALIRGSRLEAIALGERCDRLFEAEPRHHAVDRLRRDLPRSGLSASQRVEFFATSTVTSDATFEERAIVQALQSDLGPVADIRAAPERAGAHDTLGSRGRTARARRRVGPERRAAPGAHLPL